MRIKGLEVLGLALVLTGLGQPALFAQAGAPAASTRDGVYTTAQAQQGKALYSDQCAMCHGDSLEGAGQSPPLSTDAFLGDWTGQTLGDLYTKIQSTMPATSPGTLKPDQTAQLIAYILSANQFPTGAKALPSDPSALKSIHIDAPQKPQQ
ncbi:MAG TPA: c-type cytochrome [Acidobacteriaceae bacterium]|jgi:mono/diheme cytochrome c family protein|nr:c-type cytochrome [Acidobacteriaceae bacterium]